MLVGVVAIVASPAVPPALAEQRVTLQVRLAHEGVPLHADLADVEFRLHASESGGATLWSEGHGSVAVRNGLLVVELGAAESVAQALDGSPRWVAIVQNGVEIAPRIRLTAVPYAVQATSATVASGLWSAGGTITFAALAGDGLEVSGTALRVGQGFGVSVAGGTVAVDTSALVGAGADALVGDSMRVDYTPSNYTAISSSVAGHLEGIDDELATAGGGGGGEVDPGLAGGRLSASSTEAVPPADQLSATLYYLPYRSNRLSLYDATDSAWRVRSFGTGVSLDVSGLSADTNYDIFAEWSGSAVVLEAVAWSNSAQGGGSRATALTGQDGVHVASGDPGLRYLGTVRTVSSSGTKVQDAQGVRLVWNAQNRVVRMSCLDGGSWSQGESSGPVHANGGVPAFQHCFVVGQASNDFFALAMFTSGSPSGYSSYLGLEANGGGSQSPSGGYVDNGTYDSGTTFARLATNSAGYHVANATVYRFAGGSMYLSGGMTSWDER